MRRRLCTLLLAFGAASVGVRAQGRADQPAPAAIAQASTPQLPSAPPLTPGAVVLLASNQDPSASNMLRRALTDGNPDVRRAAARVASVAHPEVFDALRQALDGEQDPHVLGEFVRDVLALADPKGMPLVEPAARRAGAEGIAPIAEWLARMQPDEFVRRLPEWGRIGGVVDRLEPIVELAVSRHPDQRDIILNTWRPFATEAGWKALSKPAGREAVTMRTVEGMAAELLPDTFVASDCKPVANAIGNVLVTFSKLGRPIKLDLDSTRRSSGCQKALVALARVSLDPDDSGGLPQLLVVPMMPEFIGCTSGSVRDAKIQNIGPTSGVRAPRLKKEVKPDYTRRALNEKIEGVTEMEAIVSPAGCVTSVAITRGLVPDLDLHAIVALLQWRFIPGTLDGRPVPVIITVELTFTLK